MSFAIATFINNRPYSFVFKRVHNWKVCGAIVLRKYRLSVLHVYESIALFCQPIVRCVGIKLEHCLSGWVYQVLVLVYWVLALVLP